MKDIKVRFKGGKAPSGKRTGATYTVGKARLDAWKKDGRFDMDIEMPKVKVEPKKAPKAKKEKE
tara:strand:- start:304 stop:495 length:192 start_codon:yes stop_codon:yes gene_type:complete